MKRMVKDTDGIWKVRFDSVGEMLRFDLDGTSSDFVDDTNIAAHDSRLECWGRRSREFFHDYTVAKMRDELRHPSVQRLEAVERIESQIELPPPMKPRRCVRVRRPDGEELDPFAWVQRNPDGWSRIEHDVQRAPRLVRLGVNLCVWWKEKPEALLYRGAAIVALADYYTRLGCSVEVVAYNSSRRLCSSWVGDERSMVELVVKKSTEPLDKPMLTLVLAEIAFFRMVFMGVEFRVAPSQVSSGNGYVADMPKHLQDGFDAVMDSDIKSLDAALAFVKDHARQCHGDRNQAMLRG